MNTTHRSRRLVDPLKLNKLYLAATKLAAGDERKDRASRTVITGLIREITGLALLHTAAQGVLKGEAGARNRLVAIVRLLLAGEPADVDAGESQAPPRPASQAARRESNAEGLSSGHGLLASTGDLPCFLFPQDILPIYFGTLFVVPEESSGPVIQYLERQLAKIAPLDLLYDLAEGVLAGEPEGMEMFRQTLDIVKMGQEVLGTRQPRVLATSRIAAVSKRSTGETTPAMKQTSGEIPPRLFPMPDCLGIREDCTAQAIRAVREAQAMRARRGTCVVERIEPSRALIGETITITGSNFGDVTGEVMFPGNVIAIASEWSDTRITVTVPAGTRSGSGRVCLRIPVGTVMACGVSIDVPPDECCLDFCVLREFIVQIWAGADAYHHTHSSREDWAEGLGDCNVTSVRNLSGATIELSYTEGPEEAVPGTGAELGPNERTEAFRGTILTAGGVWWVNITGPEPPAMIAIALTCDDCG